MMLLIHAQNQSTWLAVDQLKSFTSGNAVKRQAYIDMVFNAPLK